MELVVQFPARGYTQVLLCLFPGVLWLWHFLYSVGPHPVSILHVYTFVLSRAFMAGAASQAGGADSSQAPGLTSGLQGVRECPPWCSIVGATVTVHQFFCILHYGSCKAISRVLSGCNCLTLEWILTLINGLTSSKLRENCDDQNDYDLGVIIISVFIKNWSPNVSLESQNQTHIKIIQCHNSMT